MSNICLRRLAAFSTKNKLFLSRSFSFSQRVCSNEKILKSQLPEVTIPENVSLSQHVFANFDSYSQKTALIEGISGEPTSYEKLRENCVSVASALTRRGFKKGDVLAVFCPNIPQFAVAMLAAVSIGGIVTTINPSYTTDELTHQLNDSGAKMIVTVPEIADIAKGAAQKLSQIETIFTIGGSPHEGCTSFTELLADGGASYPTDVPINSKSDLAVIPYSSGTTGLPKGVMLTHYNIIANLQQMRPMEVLGLDPETNSTLAILPFFHIYGMVAILFSTLLQGGQLVTLPRFEPETFLHTLQNYRVTRALVVPPIMLFLAKHPMVDSYDLTSLEDVLSGAAPMDSELSLAVGKRLNLNIIRQGYGLTETSPVLTASSATKPKLGSSGRLVPNTELKVVSLEMGEMLGANQEGELLFRGPQLMKGYLNNPQATAATLDQDGWIQTGDIGYYDEENNVYVSDRVKELIKYKGYQIAPAELEALLLTHPEVSDAAVIGRYHKETASELPKAYVVKKDQSHLTTEEIADFIAGKVAPYKKLRGGVEFIDQIPKSPSGKILRRILRDKK